MGKLIVIDGSDGSGKTVQTGLLVDALKKSGNVAMFDFPQYDTFFGKLIKRALHGEFGDFAHLSPYIASLPYMLDRATVRDNIRSALLRGHVVCNRYTSSNLAHQMGKLSDPAERAALKMFLEQAEFDELKLPRPDCVIFLAVPVAISQELTAQRNPVKDQHEADENHLQSASDAYRELAESEPNWHIIDCAPEGKLLSPEAIHTKVWEIVEPIVAQ